MTNSSITTISDLRTDIIRRRRMISLTEAIKFGERVESVLPIRFLTTQYKKHLIEEGNVKNFDEVLLIATFTGKRIGNAVITDLYFTVHEATASAFVNTREFREIHYKLINRIDKDAVIFSVQDEIVTT